VLYVQLDANWPDNPKVIAAGIDGAGLHAAALCIAKRLDTDGWIARPILHRQGASDELIDRLVGLELLDDNGKGVRPHDWHHRNMSQGAIAAKRAAKKRAAKEGNHKRWEHEGSVDECAICYPESQVIAGSDPVRSVCDPNSSPESESKPAASDAIAPATDALSEKRRQQRIMEAARIAAEERAIGRDVGEGWIINATKGIADDHRDALDAHLVAHPEATALELVELIDPPKRTPQKTGGVIANDDGVFLPGTGWCPKVIA
jgi:hypothetical protein